MVQSCIMTRCLVSQLQVGQVIAISPLTLTARCRVLDTNASLQTSVAPSAALYLIEIAGEIICTTSSRCRVVTTWSSPRSCFPTLIHPLFSLPSGSLADGSRPRLPASCDWAERFWLIRFVQILWRGLAVATSLAALAAQLNHARIFSSSRCISSYRSTSLLTSLLFGGSAPGDPSRILSAMA